jgi:hypothetical protein
MYVLFARLKLLRSQPHGAARLRRPIEIGQIIVDAPAGRCRDLSGQIPATQQQLAPQASQFFHRSSCSKKDAASSKSPVWQAS